MGRHAKPRTSLLRSRTARRAGAVSAGTLVLCLGAAAPAIATTGLPSPPPVPQPVSDAVQQVTTIAGVPDPIATTAPKPAHHQKPHSSKPSAGLSDPSQPTAPTRHLARPTQTAYTPVSYTLGGLRGVATTGTAAMAGRLPSVATTPTVTPIAPVAGSSPLASLPLGPASQDTARILMVALAVLCLGGLTSGHLKAAQQRLAAW